MFLINLVFSKNQLVSLTVSELNSDFSFMHKLGLIPDKVGTESTTFLILCLELIWVLIVKIRFVGSTNSVHAGPLGGPQAACSHGLTLWSLGSWPAGGCGRVAVGRDFAWGTGWGEGCLWGAQPRGAMAYLVQPVAPSCLEIRLP